MGWILIIEEYGPDIFYIPGPNNAIADALSRLPKIDDVGERQILSCKVKNLYVQTNDLSKEYPLVVVIIS